MNPDNISRKQFKKLAKKVSRKERGYIFDSEARERYVGDYLAKIEEERNARIEKGLIEEDKRTEGLPHICGRMRGKRVNKNYEYFKRSHNRGKEKNFLPTEIMGFCSLEDYEKDAPWKSFCYSYLPMNRDCPPESQFTQERQRLRREFILDYMNRKKGFVSGRLPWKRRKDGEVEMVVLNLYLDDKTPGLIKDIFVEGLLRNHQKKDSRLFQEIEPLKKKDHKSFRRYIAGLENFFSYGISGPELPAEIVDAMRESGMEVYGNRPFGVSEVFGDKHGFLKRVRLRKGNENYSREVA